MTKLKYLIDTNVVLNQLNEIINEYEIVVCSTVMQELDKHKEFGVTDEVKYQAREASRILDDHEDEITFLPDAPFEKIQSLLGEAFHPSVPDNRILATAVLNNVPLLTGDKNIYYSAKTVGHAAKRIDIPDEYDYELDYKGFVEVEMTIEEHREFLNRVDQNEFNLVTNQYLNILNKDNPEKLIEKYVYDGGYYVSYKTPKWRCSQMGNFEPYDVYQQSAMNALDNNNFVMLRGKAGTAKTLLALTYAFKEMENHSYDKLIIFSNDIPTKGAFYHGLVKGTLEDKLFDSTIGGIMSSKLGSEQQLEAMLITEKITILPMSKLRGFDTSGMNAIVLITEAQNTSRELMKLAIQRVGQDCKLIVEGDNHTQLDSREFTGNNNGMSIASEVFRGEDYYAEIELQNCYRSHWAERAEKMSL